MSTEVPAIPRVAVVYGDNSASAMAIAAAAKELCDLVWVVDSSALADATTPRLLRRFGHVLDTVGLGEEDVVVQLRGLDPSGIVAYADAHLELASSLAQSLGLDYFDTAVAHRLVDKVAQRRAFAEAGLDVPRCEPVESNASLEEFLARVREIRFPVIVKPRHGAASRETHLARDIEELAALLREVRGVDHDLELVVEEYMAGAVPPPSDYFGDYVSVESVVAHGRISHLAVTGRLPSAKPFRETGLIIPTDYAPDLVEEILAVATLAIDALGIRTGCLHTEIKVTTVGVRVLEVNGRIGGFVAPTLARATDGLDFFRLSLRVALGEDVHVDALVHSDHVGFAIVTQPPLGARRVVSVTGLDLLSAHPGVDSVTLNRRPGDPVDWRLGSHEYVVAVLGTTSTTDEVRAIQEVIDAHVITVYDEE